MYYFIFIWILTYPLLCCFNKNLHSDSAIWPLICNITSHLHIRAPICFLIQDFNLLGVNNFVILHIHLNLKLALNQSTHSVCLFRPQMNPFDSKSSTYSSSSAKPPSPETAASTTPADENQEVEQPGTPVPSEDPEVSDNGMDLSISPIWFLMIMMYIELLLFNVFWISEHFSFFYLLLFVGEKPNALAEPRGEEESLTKKGKKKKTVHWAEEEQLKHYFFFDLDETERGKTDGVYLMFCMGHTLLDSSAKDGLIKGIALHKNVIMI